jgi:hypothetical protein
MAPGASAVGLHWGSVPAVGPPPLALALAVGLVSVALLAVLFLIDAMAARERHRAAAVSNPASPAAVSDPTPPAAAVDEVGPPPASADGGFPDLARPDVNQLALARLRRFADMADDPRIGADDDRQRLARWAVFSAYRDCAALGLGPEAREVLHACPGRARELADGLSRSA